jgi:predicted RNA binding protein YcfA (HicA-like mRNA interferase family)
VGRLAGFSYRDITKRLGEHGFVFDRTAKGSHEIWWNPVSRARTTIQARMDREPAFREELLKEGVDCLLSGDVETGKAVLRDYINATLGFQELAGLTDNRPKA